MLHAEVTGTGPTLVLLHGFTQTGRSWGAFGELVGARRRLVRIDLPGHGGSAGVRATLPGAAAIVAATAREALTGAAPGSGPPSYDLLGYSLGARTALHVALAHPPGLRRLVLIGATGGIDDAAARVARRRRDVAVADDLERSGDLDGFLSRWLAAPMFAGLADPGLAERRRNTPTGLASSLRLAGTGTQEPLWDRLAAVDRPTLVVAGADDMRFVAAGRRLVGTMADAVLSLVPGAGHAAHLAQPVLAARLVEHFLAAGAPALGAAGAPAPGDAGAQVPGAAALPRPGEAR